MNNQWTYEVAESLFQDFYYTPGFLGYVAEVDHNIAAAMIGKVKKWWKGNEYLIEEFFVSPDLQSQGIGTRMLEYMHSDIKSRGIGSATLLTSTFAPAYTFYVNRGYKENQTLRFLHKKV